MKKRGKVIGLFVIIVFLLILKDSISRHQSRVALRELNQEVFMQWFGTEHPEMENLVLQWENEGLAGVLSMDDIEINAIRERVRANVEHSVAPRDHDRILTDIELILTGGFPILSEDFEAERFLSAINRIDRNNTGSNILHRWRLMLYEED